jgi:hypothetical protein
MPLLLDPQLEASATYVAAEAVTAELISKEPQTLPTLQLIVADWAKFQGGKLSATDEATLLNSIVQATGKHLNPFTAAVLDGAVQQVLANQNATAPSPLTGAAAAAITDVVNGIARAVVVATAPAAS